MGVRGLRAKICGSAVKAAKTVLQQGCTPEQIALTVCIGSAVGTLPLLWGTTVLCVGLAALFRLNQAAMQAVNYLLYPLQIALFIPFCRLGGRFLPCGPSVSTEVLKSALHGHFSNAVSALVWATVKGLAAWSVLVPPLMLLLYPLLLSIFRRTLKKRART